MTAIGEKENRYRLYSLAHFYLSSLQQGLQATHIAGKMALSYDERSEKRQMLRDWLNNGADVKLLNGGNTRDLKEWVGLFQYFESEGMNLPYAVFHDTEDNFGGAMTAIGVLVPQEIYAHPAFSEFNLDAQEMCEKYPNIPQWHLHLIYALRSCQLAR